MVLATDIVELVLLLIWRHLRYYLEQAESTNFLTSSRPQINGHDSAVSPGLQKSMSFRSLYGTQGLREAAQEAFRAVIGDMEQLQLVSDRYLTFMGMKLMCGLHQDKALLGTDARSHEALVSSLVRSITDLLSTDDKS